MGETVTQTVNTRFTQEGASALELQLQKINRNMDHARASADQLQKELDQLGRTGKISAQNLEVGSKAIHSGLNQELRALGKNLHDVTNSQGVLNQGVKQNAAALPRLRYALYDVSTTLAFAGAAMLGLAAAAVAVSIKMDRDFADVVRTTGTYMDQTGMATERLRNEFNELFSSLPASWGDLTDIGALAGQLNIASEDVAEFTELVTMFAATTDVSVEQSATAFGRLAQLLKVPADQYENLGSSILNVGVNAVATESDIISISTQIASIASLAGFSADQVFGLASALASLGTQPELARGTITRLFTNISSAISAGGARLEYFGAITKQTGAEFAAAWEDDAGAALQAFVEGLGRVDENGGDVVATLKELGISSVRDVPTILKLAQNHELLADQMGYAADGFEKGTALQEQYGVVAQTTAAKIQILGNNLQLLIGGIADTDGAFAFLIDMVTAVVKGFTDLMKLPGAQWLTTAAVAAAALGGVFLLVSGGIARSFASTLALRTALVETAVSLGLYADASAAAAVPTKVLANEVRGATVALNQMKAATKWAGIGTWVLAAATALAFLVGQSSKANEQLKAFRENLSTAIATDTKEGDASLRSFTVAMDDTAVSTDDARRSAVDAAESLVGLGDDASGATTGVGDLKEGVDQLTISLGAASDAAIRKSLAELILGDEGSSADDMQRRVEVINTALESIGVTTDEIAQGIATGKLPDALLELRNQIVNAHIGGPTAGSDEDIVRDFINSIYAEEAAVSDLIDTTGLQESVMSSLGITTAETADDFDTAVESINKMIEDFTEWIEVSGKTEKSLYDLGSGLQANKGQWSEYSQAGRENLANLKSVMENVAAQDPTNVASNFKALFNFLVAGGYASAEQLGFLRDAIVGLSNGATVVASDMSFTSFFEGFATSANKAGKSAGSAAKKVRTLLDYVSDLSKVMDDAFDFRFGFEQSTDDVISSFLDINQAFEDARQKVRDLTLAIQEYQAEISGIASDINILEYHLTIAEEYNDTLRATAIRAELEKANAKLAKTQAELADSQSGLNKATQEATPDLESSTDAAIEQRKAVLDLVSSYQDQIEAYAATGASQQEIADYTTVLKQRFEDQMRSLGYAETSIRRYSAAFDDFRVVVERVPRDLTISVNADPALRALDEYLAKLKDVKGAAGDDYFPPFDTSKWEAGLAKAAKGLELYSILVNAQQRASGYAMSGKAVPGWLTNVISTTSALLKSGSYEGGGYTGVGGTHDVAGVVHKREYVVPAKDVDQRTHLPYPDAFSRLSRGVSGPGYFNGGYVSGSNTPGTIDLSAMTLQQLQRMFRVNLYLDGKRFASSMSGQFASSTRVGAN